MISSKDVLGNAFKNKRSTYIDIFLNSIFGAIMKLKISVGWTTDKFWLNNSRAINGTILRFAYRKMTSKDVRVQIFGIFAVATTK